VPLTGAGFGLQTVTQNNGFDPLSIGPMSCRRNYLMLSFFLASLAGCGGPDTKLIALSAPINGPRLSLVVRNRSDTVIDGFYLARTEVVQRAHGHAELGSTSEAVTWGDDLLKSALAVGDEQQVVVPIPGSWDARPVDEEGRYQHIAGLRLKPGARYVLELHDGGWRHFR
jgi:hypothetical protein